MYKSLLTRRQESLILRICECVEMEDFHFRFTNTKGVALLWGDLYVVQS